jgi:hypothetical protein
MRRLALLALLAVFACATLMFVSLFSQLFARDNGQWNDIDPKVRQWFREQKSPKTSGYCCNESDGTYAEEEIRDGHYWTRFEESNGNWIPVPDEVVIRDPNRNGAPVAWWYFEKGILQIRCYAPGGGV